MPRTRPAAGVDPAAACALPVTAGAGRPDGWEWVRDDAWFTCRGRGGEEVYSRAKLPARLNAVITEAGVLPPAAPHAGSRGARHVH